MHWLILAAAIAVPGAIAIMRRRLRERSRCVAHARQLRVWLAGRSAADIEHLRKHVRALHDRAPGAATAEGWYALGCAWLNARNPEAATRAFQLACHAHPGLDSAVLLAFACLRMRGPDMPRLLPILLETYEEIRRPSIPGSAWERLFLRELGAPGADPPGLAPLARALRMIPVECIGQQMADAVARRPAWAAPLLAGPAKAAAVTGTLPA